MSAVDFHTHLSDPIQYACRLLRKVHAAGHWVTVLAPVQWCVKLNAALWTFSPLEFLPHALDGASPAVLRRSPIALMSEPKDVPSKQSRTVLVAFAAGFDPATPWLAAYPRVVELVAADDESMASGRQRFRAYRSLGNGREINVHDQRPSNH